MERPRTWRPLGARMVAIGGGVLLAIIALGFWFALPGNLRAKFTISERITLVGLGVLAFAVLFAIARCRVTASTERLLVVNAYRVRAYEWAEVLGISLRRGAPFATLDLADGSSLSVFAIQGSDGHRAIRAVQEIRALIESETPTDRDD